MTRVGLRIDRRLSYEEWERAGHHLTNVIDSSSWCLGDWLAYGKEHYSDRYEQAIRAAGLQYQTLRNYAWVSHQFPLHRRRDTLTFQHHAEVASLTVDDQDRWLDQAEQQLWTTKQLRMQVRAERNKAVDPSGRSPIPRIEVPDTRLSLWRQAAERSGMEFKTWVLATLDGAAGQTLLDAPLRSKQHTDGATSEVRPAGTGEPSAMRPGPGSRPADPP